MTRFLALPCTVLLAALATLAGCSTLPTGAPPIASFVVLGKDGAAVARAITSADSCPALSLDGRSMPMQVRSPLQAIALRGAPAGAPSSAVLTCEAAIAPGSTRASVGGQALPLPQPSAKRIVVIGDTGCRLKQGEYQDCNDPLAFPFARIAAAAAHWRPDLVVHVGDYHYREAACPADRPGCAGSPWGYGWEAWNADFFAPARSLLQAAPWVMARGNHESCARAGQGWWRFLDPRPLLARRDCNGPQDDAIGDYSEPYAVPLGNDAQLLVFDTANTSYKGFGPQDPRRAIYADTYRQLDALAGRAPYTIGVGHHPMLAFGALRDAKTGAVFLHGGDAGLLQAFGSVDPGFLPRQMSMLLSGHMHLWQQVSFASDHPTQFVAGFAGTLEDILPLPAAVAPGASPAKGAIVEHMSSWIDGFGFMTMERTGTDTWDVTVFDRDAMVRNTCKVSGRKSSCATAQVK